MLLYAIPGVVVASDLCLRIEKLTGPPNGWASIEDERPLPAANSCAVSQELSGAKIYQCIWSRAYRAVDARSVFDDLVRKVKDCLGDAAQGTRDQPVNHPDSYELLEFQSQGRRVAVSLKDKAALNQTLVFLRIYSRLD